MRAGAWLLEANRDLPLAFSPDEILGPEGEVLVLAPHPDDESLGCGGLVAARAAQGLPVHVAIVTDGRHSHPHTEAWPMERLVAQRRAETAAAVAALGLDPERDLSFIAMADCGMGADGPGPGEAMRQWLRQRPAAPATILAPWRYDPHGDHIGTAKLARALAAHWRARLLSYVVWGWAYAYPVPGFVLADEPSINTVPSGARFAIEPWLSAKRRAVMAHVSQTLGLGTADAPSGFSLPPEALALAFRGEEIYLAGEAA